MNLLFSCIGRRGYIADWFREQLEPGDRILGTSNTEWTPGFHACDEAFLLPDVSGDGYVAALLELCREERVGALLSFFDLDVDAIARRREEFRSAGVVPVVPEARVSEIAFDKLQTFHFLCEHGFPTPYTCADLGEARAALRDGRLAYPVVVKARFGFASQNLFFARNEAELEAFFDSGEDMIVQERLPGQEHSLDVLNDLEAHVVSVIVKRKILMRAGETDQAETVEHPAALELGVRLGEALGHVGPLDVDLFARGGDVWILELNPRFGGAYAVSHLAGADFPRKILDMIRGHRVARDVGSYRVGVRMMKDYRIRPGYEGHLRDLRDGVARRRSGA